MTLPITEPTAIAGGALIGSAGGAAYGFAPGFSQGYGAGYGPGAAVGGGYGQGLDQTWLGQKLNVMVKGHEQAQGKGKEAEQEKCTGDCKSDEGRKEAADQRAKDIVDNPEQFRGQDKADVER